MLIYMFNKKKETSMKYLSIIIGTMYLFMNMNALEQSKKIEISENCYKKQQQLSKDFASLKNYFQGVFNAAEEHGIQKPSPLLQYIRDKSNINEDLKLEYMPATGYLHALITDELYDKIDQLFTEKYQETQDISSTWNWFSNYFEKKILREPIDNFCKDMIKRDAAMVTLDKHGINFADYGRTMIMNGNRMSNDPKDVQEINDALQTIYSGNRHLGPICTDNLK